MSAYPISAPVNFNRNGPVSLFLTDNSLPFVWDFSTNGLGELIISCTGNPDVIHLYPSGDVGMKNIKLMKNGNAVTLTADNTLSANYTYNFPATAPTGNAQIVASSGATNVFYDVHAEHVIQVRKNPGPSEFSSVAAAIASIPIAPDPEAPADDNRYVIYINSGDYTEPQIVIPSYVFLVGVSMEGVRLNPVANGYPFITFRKRTGIVFMTIRNTDPAFPALYFLNCGDYALVHKVEIEGAQKAISCETTALATETSLCYLEYVGITDSTEYAVRCYDNNILGGFGSEVSIENFFTYGHSDNCITVNGLNSVLLSQGTVLQGDGLGNAMRVLTGARIDIRGMYIEDWNAGILVDNDANTPTAYLEGILYENCTKNIDIQNNLTVGYNDGYTEYIKTSVPKVAPFFITNKDQFIITVARKGADFTSIGAALASITDNSATNRYTIYVGPGIYTEDQLVLKSYVSIVGFFQTQSIILANDATVPLIVGAGNSSLSRVTLRGDNPAFPPATYPPYLIEFMGDPLGNHFRCDDISFKTSTDLVNIGSTDGWCVFLMFNPVINMDCIFTRGFNIDDSGPSHNPIIYLIDGLVWSPDATGLTNFTNLFVIKSTKSPSANPNVWGAIQDCAAGQNFLPPQGTCISIEGSTYTTLEGSIFGGYTLGLSIPNSAESSILVTSALNFNSNTQDVNVQSPNASGTLCLNADINKITVVSGATFGMTITDPTGSVALTGNLYQGAVWGQVTNISFQVQHAATIGSIDDEAVIASVGGLNVSVTGGSGYVFTPATHLKYLTWSAVPSLALTNNTINWVYVNVSGTVLAATSSPDQIENIVLGTVKTNAGNVSYVQQIGPLINQAATMIDQTLRNVFGPIVQSGIIATPGSNITNRYVNVSSGVYYLSSTSYSPTSTNNVPMIGYYNTAGTPEDALTFVPLEWSNAGVKTALAPAEWAKHTLYIVSSIDGATKTYLFVYGQEVFASEIDAQTGPLPIPPSTFTGNVCPIAAIIVNGADPAAALASTRFRDIRPTLASKPEGYTATADHNSLLNLAVGNAHPQYFRVDGTSTMTGDVDLGAFNIVGSGGNLLNGVDLLAHASRHLPGGADALATAAPVTIGTANAIGAAASFSRSDHVHSHGAQTDATLHAIATGVANGFMSAADKAKLDASTPNNTASTLVQRSAGGSIALTQITLPVDRVYQSALGTITIDDGSGGACNLVVTNNITANNSVIVDTISERTAAAGVTIDGLLIKDGVQQPTTVTTNSTFTTATGSVDLIYQKLSNNYTSITFSGTLTKNGNGSAITANTAINASYRPLSTQQFSCIISGSSTGTSLAYLSIPSTGICTLTKQIGNWFDTETLTLTGANATYYLS